MGFTPLDGVVMGTRTGSMDPAAVSYTHLDVYKRQTLTTSTRATLKYTKPQAGDLHRGKRLISIFTGKAKELYLP